MTNEQIIWDARVALYEEGKIGGTGRTVTVEDRYGETRTIPEPEQIHTYAAWKELSYQVKKGEKAVVKIKIWRRAEKKNDEEEPGGYMFMTEASFFSSDQVERIGG